MKLLANFKNNITEILAVLITVASFAFLFLLPFVKVPPENKDIVNTTLGFVLGSLVSGVAGYYFGSSKIHKAPDTTELTSTITKTTT